MSKKAKASARALRRARKAARKAAQNLQYAAWKLAGQNSKSRRAKLRKRRATAMRTRTHAQGPCGNVGCKRCNPALHELETSRQQAAE